MADAPNRRVQLFDILAAKGSTFGDAEWAMDDKLERAYLAWLRAGSPENVTVTVENGLADGREEIVIRPRKTS